MKGIGVCKIRSTTKKGLQPPFGPGNHGSVISEQQASDNSNQHYTGKICSAAFLSVSVHP